ncbi:hypothetical protein A0H81_10114 [Grifola frondosa]|uniref:Uncharacterized protein n=1 Tax=Grifola frondosa TaxID=5627 RepID=A0A1C7LYG2_GRIFR|nr:hypothetical protein A0H81_10114 [Grifola frondosa]
MLDDDLNQIFQSLQRSFSSRDSSHGTSYNRRHSKRAGAQCIFAPAYSISYRRAQSQAARHASPPVPSQSPARRSSPKLEPFDTGEIRQVKIGRPILDEFRIWALEWPVRLCHHRAVLAGAQRNCHTGNRE